jgi:RimJ/RimL family protein N-acetyltransferase
MEGLFNKLVNIQISGQKVTLRQFTDSNITNEYLGWLNDRELMKFSNQRFRSHSTLSCNEYLKSFDGTDNLFLAIYHGSEYIGTITAYVTAIHKIADMGLLIGWQSQGRGLGLDAWFTLMRYLFENIGVRKVSGGALKSNAAMIKIMVNSGMRPDGVRLEHEMVEGRPDDIVHFAKFNM